MGKPWQKLALTASPPQKWLTNYHRTFLTNKVTAQISRSDV
jgi:hypothetical protein